MEKKVHYKLHKVKKQWVTIAVTSLALLGLRVSLPIQSVSADTTDTTTVVSNDSGAVDTDSDSSTSQSQDTVATAEQSDTSLVSANNTNSNDSTVSTDAIGRIAA